MAITPSSEEYKKHIMTRSLKVLILSAANSVHTVRWVNALAERGIEVHLAYLPNHAPSKYYKILDSVKLHPLGIAGYLGYYLNGVQLSLLSKRIKPDVINAHFASGYGTLARVSRLKPLLVSVWGSDVYDFPYKNRLAMSVLKRNLNYPEAIASTSECMARKVKTLVENKTVYITPFGVEVSNFRTKEVSKKSEQGGTIRIGNIKTLKPLYRIDVLINATSYLLKNLCDHGYGDLAKKVQVEIYGEGPERDALQRIITSLELDDTVHLKGSIPNTDVPRVLSTFDIFCVTSDRESFGVSVIEAMAASLPVVATNTDGFREVMNDGKTGFIVERNNPRETAIALEELVVNLKLRKQLGNSGRSRVMDKYSWDKNVTTMIEAYEALITERKT